MESYPKDNNYKFSDPLSSTILPKEILIFDLYIIKNNLNIKINGQIIEGLVNKSILLRIHLAK